MVIIDDILKMEGIVKKFGSMTANDSIDITVKKGEILALLGENGAGKSTLMNILYGLYQPTSGKIFFEGKEVTIDSPLKAIELGIGMVHQHFMLIPAFKTWENVVLGLTDEQKNILDEKGAKEKITRIAGEYNLHIDPGAQISTLPVGLQQQVEILKVLYRGSRLLILDEPTGVLTPPEKVKLFETLRGLADNGIAIIFISHKLDEVIEISDRVCVLCRGKNIGTEKTKDMTKQKLAKMMVGREVVFTVEKEGREQLDEEVLKVENLSVKGKRLASSIKQLSFSIHAGEVFGIAGVDGNGQSELVEAIAGLRKVESGKVIVAGDDMTNKSPRDFINHHVSLVPEDRKETGSVKNYNIDKNLILRNMSHSGYCKHGTINYKKIKQDADQVIKEYDIRLSERNYPVVALSGGNLQKVILAREIKACPRLLLAMHPTRGLDVGAIEFIHKKILEVRHSQAAVLLVSSELEEIMALSDRVVIMSDGKFSEELTEDSVNIENIGLLMGGETLGEREG